MPAIVSENCTGIGVIIVPRGGGYTCKPCHDLRKRKRGSHPKEFIKSWSLSIRHCIDRRTRVELKSLDLDAANNFLHKNPKKLTEDMLCLLEETIPQAKFDKEMAKLATQVPKTEYKLNDTNSVPIVPSFLSKVGDMFEKYPLLQDYIVFQDLLAMVFEKCVSRKILQSRPN